MQNYTKYFILLTFILTIKYNLFIGLVDIDIYQITIQFKFHIYRKSTLYFTHFTITRR